MNLVRVPPRGWTHCIVAATGPSLTEAVAEQCRGQRVIAVNDAYRRLPFADVLYACDREWLELHQGCPDFAGERWTSHEDRHNDKRGLPEAWGWQIVAGKDHEGFSLNPAVIHYGGNSGFQAINLAILFGATHIRLVGFDMRTPPAGQPRHYFGDHPPSLKNSGKYEYFIPAFNEAARRLPSWITIVNCTPNSALTCFPMAQLEDALA